MANQAMPIISSQKPFVVPIFIPHAGCPHRCVFCDQTQTTGISEKIPSIGQLHETIDRFLKYRRDPGRFTEISFYGGNFLGLAVGQINFLLQTGAGYVSRGVVNGLRFSTRPDTITSNSLEFMANFPVSTVELGVQSMNETVLKICRRGHGADDTRRAVAGLRRSNCRLGLQMMVGLPGDTPAQAMATAHEIAALQPDFVRIYPTLVLKGSALAQWYAQGRYVPLELDACVQTVKTLLAYFSRKKIKVVRMGLQPTADLNPQAGVLAGPFHPAFGELVHCALWSEALKSWLSNLDLGTGSVEITVHPSMLSRVRGQKNKNVKDLCRQFNLAHIRVIPDSRISDQTAMVNGCQYHLFSAPR